MPKLMQLQPLSSWLSLDVVFGAMASMYFFQELFHEIIFNIVEVSIY
jgi:hypothetical protein